MKAFDYEKPLDAPRAEIDLISGVLFKPSVLDEVSDIEEHHFWNACNQLIWRAIRAIDSSRQQLTALMVAEWLDGNGLLKAAGGVEYLSDEVLGTCNESCCYHVRTNANLILRKWRARHAVDGCREVLELVRSKSSDEDVATKADQVLTEIAELNTPTSTVEIKDVLQDVMGDISARLRGGRPAGLPTGFTDLDKLLIGLLPHELIVLAARPAMGKTAFICSLALNVAKAGGTVLFHSIEMAKTEIAERMLCVLSDVAGDLLKGGHVNRDALTDEMALDDLMRAASTMQSLPIFIDDSASQKVRTISATARRLKRKNGLSLIVIDYLQLIEPREFKVPREQQVAQISKSLKALAKELSVPVLVLAQLNREVEKRVEKTPQLSDLRESGSVEQDADVVMFLHRPSAYDPTDRPGECDVLVKKNRRGNVGKATLAWIAASTKFADMAFDDVASRASRAFPSRDW